jgi:general stress protein YciG
MGMNLYRRLEDKLETETPRMVWWKTMIAKHGSEEAVKQHMAEIARLNKGQKRPGTGFAADRERAVRAGRLGGRISRKKSKKGL